MEKSRMEIIQNWLIYFILVIYLVVSPAAHLLTTMGIPAQPLPWVYLILLLLLLYLGLKFLQTVFALPIDPVDLSYLAALALLLYVIYAEFVSGLLLAQSLPRSGGSVQSTLANTTIFFVVFFLVGSRLPDLHQLLHTIPAKIMTWLFYLFYCAVIYWTALSLSSAVQGSAIINLDSRFNYLYISDTLAIFSLLVLWLLVNNTPLRWLIAVHSMTLLFITRSRTSFFLFIFCWLAVFLFRSRSKLNWLMLGLVLGLFLLLGGSELIFNNQAGIMFSLVIDPENDPSNIARRELFINGLKTLQNYWLLGLPLAELWLGQAGEYIHNYLSFWVCFGILPFLSFILLSLYNLGRLIVLTYRHPFDDLLMFVLTYSLFVYIEIITSRSYVYPYVWACLAAVPVICRMYSAGLEPSSRLDPESEEIIGGQPPGRAAPEMDLIPACVPAVLRSRMHNKQPLSDRRC